jgi:hypothetical protein
MRPSGSETSMMWGLHARSLLRLKNGCVGMTDSERKRQLLKDDAFLGNFEFKIPTASAGSGQALLQRTRQWWGTPQDPSSA